MTGNYSVFPDRERGEVRSSNTRGDCCWSVRELPRCGDSTIDYDESGPDRLVTTNPSGGRRGASGLVAQPEPRSSPTLYSSRAPFALTDPGERTQASEPLNCVESFARIAEVHQWIRTSFWRRTPTKRPGGFPGWARVEPPGRTVMFRDCLPTPDRRQRRRRAGLANRAPWPVAGPARGFPRGGRRPLAGGAARHRARARAVDRCRGGR
jgi:hypothetical protein